MAQLLYGGGLRLMEVLRLRVKDLDFDLGANRRPRRQGHKDRVTVFPFSLPGAPGPSGTRPPQDQSDLDRVAAFSCRTPSTQVPAAGREWLWQYVFPSARLSVDPRSGLFRRHHLDPPICKRRSAARPAPPASPSPSAAIPSAIPSPLTCLNPITISAPSRSSSATPT